MLGYTIAVAMKVKEYGRFDSNQLSVISYHAMQEEKKFTTKDKPLSASQAEEIGKIRVKDVKEAITTADEDLKPFLEAKQQKKKR